MPRWNGMVVICRRLTLFATLGVASNPYFVIELCCHAGLLLARSRSRSSKTKVKHTKAGSSLINLVLPDTRWRATGACGAWVVLGAAGLGEGTACVQSRQ